MAPCACAHAALRVMEVRVAYANEDFEWDNLKKIALKVRSRRFSVVWRLSA